eukprot:CAMPEP_0174870940 /NCGR_PEP_ID=MMETSP1114-20130205/70616_1 /TAXON_ID=312471 /ORGANISM="Neobodo designis, Strain CCAP 1951/1" /LENGTH=114 /DNA_ID=CAMNT_0016106215 /DNA_START=37 /DNA_END=377 /DNA_ORIENTATION=-
MALHAATLRLAAASSVTDTTSGAFVAPGSHDLLLVRANVLALHTWDAAAAALRCVAETALPARVVAAVTVPGAFVDADVDRVLVMTDETHASLIAWDPASHAFETEQLFVLSPP